jgi:hypothetical protein
VLSSQSVDFNIVYSNQMNTFSLDKRWTFYNNSGNTGPNRNLQFFTLQDKMGSSTISATDVQVLFKSQPNLQIEEDVFFELPFQGDLFKVTGTVVPDRGNTFYVTTVPLSSLKDFNMRVFFGNTELTKSSLAYQGLSVPGGNSMNISFSYDLLKNATYGSNSGDPKSFGLLYPLKPVCQELQNQPYQPWVSEPLRDASLSQGNYAAVCDLDTTAARTEVGAQPSLMDTWHNFFSYAPQRLDKNELGHLYGIRSITFLINACIQLQVKAPGTSQWQTVTTGVPNCGGQDQNLWTPVTVQKTFTIYDNTDQYLSVLNLSSILRRFKGSAVQSYPTMKLNNENLNGDAVRHLY